MTGGQKHMWHCMKHIFHPNKSTSSNYFFFSSGCNFWGLWGRLTRRWKAKMLNFSRINFWVPFGYHVYLQNPICTWVKLVNFSSIFILVQACYYLGTMGTSMLPDILESKSMISVLSNATSHVSLWLLSVSVKSYKFWDAFVIFKGKVTISEIHQIWVKMKNLPRV